MCPISHEPLRREGNVLITVSGGHSYPISASGIPLFATQLCSAEARQQQQHYDKVATAYLENLTYPHTQEYFRYLDDAFMSVLGDSPLGDVAEICCGRGEAMRLIGHQLNHGIGVDISLAMLEQARKDFPLPTTLFAQGDATMLPLQSDRFDHVIIFGGIHHVNDRRALFREIFRILKPGGRFIYREPVSDFFLWRWLRSIIYRISPALDADTERPLRHTETVPVLEEAGFRSRLWRTYGFFGGALLLNSDVLVFNRVFRFLPGIRSLTRAMATLDDWMVRLPPLRHAGLQVIGLAEKPGDSGLP